MRLVPPGLRAARALPGPLLGGRLGILLDVCLGVIGCTGFGSAALRAPAASGALWASPSSEPRRERSLPTLLGEPRRERSSPTYRLYMLHRIFSSCSSGSGPPPGLHKFQICVLFSPRGLRQPLDVTVWVASGSALLDFQGGRHTLCGLQFRSCAGSREEVIQSP